MTKEQIARDTTNKIFEVILEEHNGYSKDEIKAKDMASNCEGEVSWERIFEVVKKGLAKK